MGFSMGFQPSEKLSKEEVQSGLKLVVADGLAAESMVAFTQGAFLVAMAIQLGASNFQLGILAALPTFSSIFQLVSIWLVQRYNNRRVITLVFNFLARFPLFIIGLLPFLFSAGSSMYALIFFLFFHYYFGSVAGASWNSWMRDLVPTEKLGSYFSHRSKMMQSLNVVLSLATAFALDHIKLHYPQYELWAYSGMFLLGGIFGMIGIFLLSRTPEPKSDLIKGNVFNLLQKPLRDSNFRKLLSFNSFWAFALNLATPFFSVYMMKTLGISLSYIIILGIIGQISSIVSLKMWGRYSDKYSNKTIINISAPVYILCIMAWAFTTMPSSPIAVLFFLVLINIFSGISTAGINLAINNIGMKLAPKEDAITYLSVKNMVVAFFSAIAPMLGGLMADFFSSHQLVWSFEWKNAEGSSVFPLVDLQGWSFFFIIGGLLAMYSLRILSSVREQGEVHKERVVGVMRTRVRRSVKREAKGIFKRSTSSAKRVAGFFSF